MEEKDEYAAAIVLGHIHFSEYNDETAGVITSTIDSTFSYSLTSETGAILGAHFDVDYIGLPTLLYDANFQRQDGGRYYPTDRIRSM
jgi:hypothetical protein